MIHVVSGFVRTGTSMMMACLTAGGLTSAFDPARERLNDHGDEHYRPNRSGFYELSMRECGKPGWPIQHQGKLIKVMSWFLDSLEPNQEGGGYRIVLMHRDPEEIRQSFEAAFGERIDPATLADYRERQAAIFRRLMVRRDVQSVIPLAYRAVVAHPEVYPVDIDPTVTSNITTDADDGFETNGTTWTFSNNFDRFGV